MENAVCVGMDIGYGNVCIASGGSDLEDLSVYPVGVGSVTDESLSTSLKRNEAVKIMVDGETYLALIDPAKVPMSARTLSSDYTNSTEYMALFNAVLKLSGRGAIDRLVTGLPVSQYKDKDVRSALVSRLSGVQKIGPNEQVVVKKVSVIPQPFGAYLDALKDENYTELFGEADVLIIDPGFFSVDWLSVYRYDLQMGFSGSSAGAASRVLDEAKNLIEAESGGRINTARIESALREGSTTVLLGGTKIEYYPYLMQAANKIAPQVLEEIVSSMRDKTYDVDFIVLAGGAVSFYEEAVRDRFPRSQIITTDQSVLANARGFFSYAQMGQ